MAEKHFPNIAERLFFFLSFKLQKVSEKVGGAEGTKLDDDFKEMERVSLNTDMHNHYFCSFFLFQDGFPNLLSLSNLNSFDCLKFCSVRLSFLILVSLFIF